jgi:hypothetical protein
MGSNINKSGMEFVEGENTVPIKIKKGKCRVHYITNDSNNIMKKVDKCILLNLKPTKISNSVNKEMVGTVCATSIDPIDKTATTFGFCESNKEKHSKYIKTIAGKITLQEVAASVNIKRVVNNIKNRFILIRKNKDINKKYWGDGKCIFPYYNKNSEVITECIDNQVNVNRYDKNICATSINLVRKKQKQAFCLDKNNTKLKHVISENIIDTYNPTTNVNLKLVTKQTQENIIDTYKPTTKVNIKLVTKQTQDTDNEELVIKHKYLGPYSSFTILDNTSKTIQLAKRGSVGIKSNLNTALQKCDQYGDVCKGLVKTRKGKITLRGDETARIKGSTTNETMYIKEKYRHEVIDAINK